MRPGNPAYCRSRCNPPERPLRGLSASDLARAARSNWAFFASAAALRRSVKPVFLNLFISILYAKGEVASAHRVDGFRSAFAMPYCRAAQGRRSRRNFRDKKPAVDKGHRRRTSCRPRTAAGQTDRIACRACYYFEQSKSAENRSPTAWYVRIALPCR